MCELSGPYAVPGLVPVHTPRLLDEGLHVQLDAGDGHQLFMTIWLNAFGDDVPQEARRPWWDTDWGMSRAIGHEPHMRGVARPKVTERWLLDVATVEQPIRYREQGEWKERDPWPKVCQRQIYPPDDAGPTEMLAYLVFMAAKSEFPFSMVEKKDVCAWIHDVIRGKFRRWGDKLSVGDDAVKDLINEIFQALCLRYYSPINGGTLRRFIRETARGLGKASITAASHQLPAKEIAAAEYAEQISEQKDAAGEHHQLPPAVLPTLTPYVGQLVDRDGAEVYPAWQIAKDTGVHIRAVYRWMNAHGCGMVDGVRVLTTAQRQAFEAEQRDKQILKELQALAQEKGFTEDAARKKVQRLREQGHSFEKIFKDLRSSRPRPYRKRTPPHGETK